MADTSGWSIDADLAFEPLARLGWHCEWVSWREPAVDWDDWQAAYLAATWDYPEDPEGFLAVVGDIDRSRAVLVNPLDLVRWNIAKTYLRDLEANGADIVPSRWFDRFDAAALADCFDAFDTGALIVKPVVSTNAADTYVVERSRAGVPGDLGAVFAHRAHVVQPFIDTILAEGEVSLFYIGGRYSHAIRKVPARGDFRVQEEHGADIRPDRPEPGLLAAADRVMATVVPEPLYGRIDFVRDRRGVYRVMELELIEPSLYLRMDESAPERFACAFDRYVTRDQETFE